MKRISLLLLAAWSFCFLGTGKGHAAPVHDFADKCTQCHLSDPSESAFLFVDGLDQLCRQCHPIPQKNTHPSAVQPKRSLPDEFLWDANGELDADLSCVTCHAPHADADGNAFLLRGTEYGSDFCGLCHSEAVTASGRHFAVSFVAHPRTTDLLLMPGATTSLQTESSSTIDPISAECLTCHDGSGGPHASFCLLMQKDKGCGGHIISADYTSLAESNSELRPAETVAQTLSLFAGEITCLTCHSIYSHEGKMLAVNNGGSALCIVCHRL